jgi:hypothetical protein
MRVHLNPFFERNRRDLPKLALKTILISFLLSSVLLPFSNAALLETIPLDSWVYNAVDELHCQGFFSSLHKNVKPYTRGEIASLVLDLNLIVKNGMRLTDSQLWLLHKLNQEFRVELEELHYRKRENTRDQTTIRYGISPVAHSTWAEGDSSYRRLQARFEVGLQFGRRFALKDRVVIDNKAEKERRYQGREWKGHLTGVLDQAYANIDLRYLQFLLGRDHLRWGPGREDVLLLSDQIPPFDMVKIEGKAGSFKLIFFASVLDQMGLADYGSRAKRYLSGHRINLKLAWVEMGVSEVILYGGENRDLEPYYLNPILPYYGEQHNNYHDDNILWSFDIALFLFRNKEIYFELLVDDFQYDFESEPHQTGFQIGLKWAQPFGWQRGLANLEYTKINNWVYGQNKPQNRYTYHGYGMGSILGPDADRWSYRLIYHFTKDIDLSLEGQYRRKGEGRIDIPQNPAVSYSNKFPSGIVEKTNTHRLTFTYQPSANLKLDLSVGFNNIENLGNESDQKEDALVFKAQLGLNLWKERRL